VQLDAERVRTAFAIAGAVGMIGGSASPRAPV
jgi:hypothetical protein